MSRIGERRGPTGTTAVFGVRRVTYAGPGAAAGVLALPAVALVVICWASAASAQAGDIVFASTADEGTK